MNRSEYLKFSVMAVRGEIADDLNPALCLHSLWTALLVQAANGTIDLNEIAKRTLESRGMDASGVWVGFGKSIK